MNHRLYRKTAIELFKGLSLVMSIHKMKELDKRVLSKDEVLKWNDLKKDMFCMV